MTIEPQIMNADSLTFPPLMRVSPATPPTRLVPVDSHSSACTFSSMCVSLKTRATGVMCSFLIRSLLRTSMACSMRLLTSLELKHCDTPWLAGWLRNPFVKLAKICHDSIAHTITVQSTDNTEKLHDYLM